MEIWGKIFLILSSGLFLLLFLLLFEHPKRYLIGGIIFSFIVVSIFFDGVSLLIALSLISSPLIIFLDVKRIGWKTALIYVSVFLVFIPLFDKFLVGFIPFYIYPILVFTYVIIARRRPYATIDN